MKAKLCSPLRAGFYFYISFSMCRSSGQLRSAMKESQNDSKDVKLSSTENNENDNVSSLDQKKRDATTAISGRHLQFQNTTKDISSKDTISPSSTNKVLSSRSTVYQLNTEDISIALATFPEFFPQGLVVDQDTLALSTKNLSVTKKNPQSECGGLVLWYIREYGL